MDLNDPEHRRSPAGDRPDIHPADGAELRETHPTTRVGNEVGDGTERNEQVAHTDDGQVPSPGAGPDAPADTDEGVSSLDPELAAMLAELTVRTPPPDLRGIVLAAASRRRPAYAPVLATVSEVEAFRRTAAELDALLGELRPEEWAAPTVTGTVRSLVGHVTGVERYMLAALGEGDHPDPERDTDHVGVTEAAMRATADATPEHARAAWHEAATSFLDAIAAVPADRTVPTHGLPVSARGALVLRTFEVWTHTEDICRATGRRLRPPEPDRLQVMSRSLLDALPFGMHLAGEGDAAGTVEITLTGEGGAHTIRRLGPEGSDGATSVHLTADVVDMCRFASRRVPLDELAVTVDGDAELGRQVLRGLVAFAMD